MADVNYYLEFLLSDHPAAEQVRLWWRLCDQYGQEDARRYWLALQNRDSQPLEAAAASWAIRDRLEVTRARITLEAVARFAIDPLYRYPAHFLGQAALDQEVLLDVDLDRPYPSLEADTAELQVGDMMASADEALPTPPYMYRAVFFHWKVAAQVSDAQWYELPARAELILVPADCQHSLLRARQELSRHLHRVEALASEMAPPKGRTGASKPGGLVGEPVAHRAAALADLDWHTAVADALEAAIADTLLWFRQQELGVRTQRTDLDTLLRLAHTNPAMTSFLAGVWGELHRSERAADLRIQGDPMLWHLARQAAASLADCPPDLTGELELADQAYAALVHHRRDLRAALLTADERPAWRRWFTSSADTRERAARHADLTVIEARLQAAERQLRELLSAQQLRTAWLAEHSGVLAVGLLAAAELRDRRGVILQYLALAPPDYLIAELGACPDGTAAREQWLRGALLIEHYRVDHTITDTARALGARPADQVGRARHDRVAQQLRMLRATLDRHRDPPSRIHPAGPDLPPAGFD